MLLRSRSIKLQKNIRLKKTRIYIRVNPLSYFPPLDEDDQHYLQTIMKNLMSNNGCGTLLFCSAPDRCRALCQSWVLRNTSSSLGSKGTSELQSSSLGKGKGEGEARERVWANTRMLFTLFSPKCVNGSRGGQCSSDKYCLQANRSR